ncbi:hypothetical protein [Xenorhabdus griffiniae]|uniref:hypothetical protein n=1 Tax=Xenorhabdus griffiniae TaxID=351672 RepID=UPI00235918FC|nr:hypothetical protein [Xenorhabdus griffiniae]MDC9605604.1 hypothetical protein [Xenorhabdus griffiniae]
MTEMQKERAYYIAIFESHYNRVLQIVVKALAQSKLLALNTALLKQESPTFKERANILSDVQKVMRSVADTLGLNYDATVLDEYIDLMHKMADAIEDNNADELQKIVEILDRKPFICQEFK